jgi:hypothetical protein
MLDCDQPCRNLSPVTATADLGQECVTYLAPGAPRLY